MSQIKNTTKYPEHSISINYNATAFKSYEMILKTTVLFSSENPMLDDKKGIKLHYQVIYLYLHVNTG